MNKPLLGFRRIVFHLRAQKDGTATLARIVGEYVNGKERCFSSKTEKLLDQDSSEFLIPDNVWERMTSLSAIAACTHLYLPRAKTLKTLNEIITYLQSNCSLRPIGTGPKFGKHFVELLQSGSTEFKLFPFQQRRLHNKFTTCIHELALDSGLSPNHFQFVLHDTKADSDLVGDEIGPSELEKLLQAGCRTSSGFRADLNTLKKAAKCPIAPSNGVSLKELGPILGHYRELIQLPVRTIADRLQSWTGKSPQWRIKSLGNHEDIQSFLNREFFAGKVDEVVPFNELGQLLSAFDDPDDAKDVPELMAEWLTAESRSCRCVRLPFSTFSTPGVSKHGTKATYTSAPFRLEGMECALVRLEFEANAAPPKSKRGKGEFIDRLSELLRNIDEEDTHLIPHSNLHVHPGDELIFVTEGTLFVDLENTGIWTPLLEGDFIHFNAEIPHSVWNTSKEKAVAIIVRFFQLERHGTRRRQIETLSQIESLMAMFAKDYSTSRDVGAESRDTRMVLLDRLAKDFPKWVQDTRDIYRLWKQVEPWVHDRTRPPQDRLRFISDDSRVQDLVGLSKFLHTHISQDFPQGHPIPESLQRLRTAIQGLDDESPNDDSSPDESFSHFVEYQSALSAFCKSTFSERDIPEARSCFDGVPFDGHHAPGIRVLSVLAKIIGIPRVLLDGYLASTALRVVVVRGAKSANDNTLFDWVKPLEHARGTDAEGVQYLLPSRSLANSDMSVTLLDLYARGHSDWNHHPGFELVIPLDGCVWVEFKDGAESPTEAISNDAMLVYRSAYSHRVCNRNNGRSRVIVMRFNIVANLPTA